MWSGPRGYRGPEVENGWHPYRWAEPKKEPPFQSEGRFVYSRMAATTLRAEQDLGSQGLQRELVAIVLGLVRASLLDADVLGLVVGHGL
jgi:hypothetical protein